VVENRRKGGGIVIGENIYKNVFKRIFILFLYVYVSVEGFFFFQYAESVWDTVHQE